MEVSEFDELTGMFSGLALSSSELECLKERAEKIERGNYDENFCREVQDQNRRYLRLIAFDLANADEAFIHDYLRLSVMETKRTSESLHAALYASLCAYRRILSLLDQDTIV